MFSYYGGKSKLINYYPAAKYDTIIEPFAGSARYCLRFFDKNCWVNDKYDVIFDIWNWIVNSKISDLDKIPDIKKGENIKDFSLDDGLEKLLGFAVNYSSSVPKSTYTNWAARDNEVKRLKNRLSKYLEKISHWKVTNLDYFDLPDIEATWFIDPPYQFGGKYYYHNEMDYKKLAEWCKSRKGQVIVCENSKADWLPFIPFKSLRGAKYKTDEVVYIKN